MVRGKARSKVLLLISVFKKCKDSCGLQFCLITLAKCYVKPFGFFCYCNPNQEILNDSLAKTVEKRKMEVTEME